MEHFALFDSNNTVARDVKDISKYVSESIMNIYGLIVDVDLKRYPGMSSKELALEILKENGLKEQEISERLNRFLEDLPYSYYNVAWSDRITVAEGAVQLLDELKRNNIGLGITTGEPQRISKMRLDKVKLSDYFTFGSYAEDGISPREIIDAALNRASSELGLQAEEGFYFSPFPRFISAGREAGLYTVGVPGVFNTMDLSSAGANEVLQSFKDKPKMFKEL